MITFEIIEEPDKIKEYYPAWEKLFDAGEYEASLSLEWTEALIHTHLEGAGFCLIVLYDATGILGLVPLAIGEVRKHGLSLVTVFPVSEYFNTHSDLLLKDASQELLQALLAALSGLKRRWNIFRMNRFVETSPALEHLTRNLKNNSAFDHEISRAEPSFFIPLDDSYDDFLKKLSAKFRYKLKSVMKKIHSMGDVTFRGIRDFHDFAEVYATLLSIEKNSWKHEHGTAITSSEKKSKFYRELCEGAFNKGRLRLCVLYLNHQPIAYEMGLLKGKRYYSVHGSYDEKFKKENPGTVLLARFIEDLIRDGIHEHDFFGEPFEWQTYWTDKFRWHKSLLIYNKTAKARLFFIFNKLKKMRRNDINDQVVLRNPRDMRP